MELHPFPSADSPRAPTGAVPIVHLEMRIRPVRPATYRPPPRWCRGSQKHVCVHTQHLGQAHAWTPTHVCTYLGTHFRSPRPTHRPQECER